MRQMTECLLVQSLRAEQASEICWRARERNVKKGISVRNVSARPTRRTEGVPSRHIPRCCRSTHLLLRAYGCGQWFNSGISGIIRPNDDIRRLGRWLALTAERESTLVKHDGGEQMTNIKASFGGRNFYPHKDRFVFRIDANNKESAANEDRGEFKAAPAPLCSPYTGI